MARMVRMSAPREAIEAARGLVGTEHDDMIDSGWDDDASGKATVRMLASFMRSAGKPRALPGGEAEIVVNSDVLGPVVEMVGTEADEMEKGGYADRPSRRQIRNLDAFYRRGKAALVDVRPYRKRGGRGVRGHKRRAPRRRR